VDVPAIGEPLPRTPFGELPPQTTRNSRGVGRHRQSPLSPSSSLVVCSSRVVAASAPPCCRSAGPTRRTRCTRPDRCSSHDETTPGPTATRGFPGSAGVRVHEERPDAGSQVAAEHLPGDVRVVASPVVVPLYSPQTTTNGRPRWTTHGQCPGRCVAVGGRTFPTTKVGAARIASIEKSKRRPYTRELHRSCSRALPNCSPRHTTRSAAASRPLGPL